jgi:cyclopropane-fatty-acyl-phospholipid synthase
MIPEATMTLPCDKKPIAYGIDLLRRALGSVSWLPELSLSKAVVTSLFTRIKLGTLIVITRPLARLKHMDRGWQEKIASLSQVLVSERLVRKESFWVRLFLFADTGFAAAFMLSEIDCPDLTSFFQVRCNDEAKTSWY